MHNAERLFEARKRGAEPLLVCIDLDVKTKIDQYMPFDEDYPQLHIGPQENLRRLDLRCVYGTRVKVGGFDAERVAAVVQACIDAGATRVIGCVHEQRGELYPVTSITDTGGALKWQAS